MITKIDHIGIAVRDLEVSKTYYRDALGLKLCGEETVDSQQVKTAFFEAGEVHIELLEATAPTSPIAKYIEKKRGRGAPRRFLYRFNRERASGNLRKRHSADSRAADRGSRR